MELHKSVLLEESINLLNIKEDGVYIDATLGYGGHSGEILKRANKGFLFAFDQDYNAVEYSTNKLSKIGKNFKIINDNFVNMTNRINENNVTKADGILFDLGVSSVQLDDGDRGFSFHQDAPLDMRMNQKQELSAYDVVNNYSLNDLIRIFKNYGEEKYAVGIANRIVNYRKNKKIETTLELVDIIKTGMPMKAMRDSHPARRVFQAIRIEVNDELNALTKALEQAINLINIGGRVCVITFHSLEDKIVKNIFQKYCDVNSEIKKLPFIPNEYLPKYKIVEKGIIPSHEELENNNRARSSRLRAIERIRD